MRGKTMLRVTVIAVMLTMLVGAPGAGAFHEGGLVLLNSHTFTWVDPDSGGVIEATENVYEGCQIPEGDFIPHDMTFEYVVNNISYDPIPGITNGFSGFQILFPQQVPEVYNQLSPTSGGPWEQNAYSGQFPPWGIEWDVPLPNLGIMPGETGTFSYCTYEREDVVVEPPDAGWMHTWGQVLPDGTVVNTQTFLFNVPNSVPGREYYEAGYSCSDGHEVCKKVKYLDEDYDGLIEVGEPISFLQVIQVHNGTDMVWEDVIVEDRFGAEIGVASAVPDRGTVMLETKGNSNKVFLGWDIGDLGPGETANLVMRTYTDLDPGGYQEYTECSYHEYNSGAVLKFRREHGKASYETGEIILSVLTVDALGDCDGGGTIDTQELDMGTDPHDPTDDPYPCSGVNDICIDADGTVSPDRGFATHAEVTAGAPLIAWPTDYDVEGIDWFDNDATCTWTFGDDIHVEGPAYPTAFRDALHDDNADYFDPLVLDLDLSLFDGQPVDVDLESGSAFSGCPGPDPLLKFHDADFSGNWDDGEDIVLDTNGNGVFD